MSNRPLIAILRGITTQEAPAHAHALIEAGITHIEVTLNSPNAIESIEAIISSVGEGARIGAGTVSTVAEVEAVAAVGGRFIISPHVDAAVIAATKKHSMISLPGVFTATEAFTALAAGADAIKFFPADLLGEKGLRSLRAVLPSSLLVYMVGGVGTTNFASWLDAGANGFGLGQSLYRQGQKVTDTATKATNIVTMFDAIVENPASQEPA